MNVPPAQSTVALPVALDRALCQNSMIQVSSSESAKPDRSSQGNDSALSVMMRSTGVPDDNNDSSSHHGNHSSIHSHSPLPMIETRHDHPPPYSFTGVSPPSYAMTILLPPSPRAGPSRSPDRWLVIMRSDHCALIGCCAYLVLLIAFVIIFAIVLPRLNKI